ncbi:alpha/beta hydrolase [Devriesea agamarum]|uniref:alpha/beta hydrolase n=1 Tax=Devriesea agamarum TaxID=472569 RepID=UPI00071D6342|nr:alpha/beta hydrolase [Devriesea agamarum]
MSTASVASAASATPSDAERRDQFGRTPRPAYDPAVAAFLERVPPAPLDSADDIPVRRAGSERTLRDVLAQLSPEQRDRVAHDEIQVPGYKGHALTVSLFRDARHGEAEAEAEAGAEVGTGAASPDAHGAEHPQNGGDAAQGDAAQGDVAQGAATKGPGFVFFHGGGMMFGNRFHGIELLLPWIFDHGGVLMSVEYRLAPEHPAPIPVEDCYAALVALTERGHDLGFDPQRLILIGVSAGGGLAAGTMLLARDRRGPSLLGVNLICPMLDDRNDSLSCQQFETLGTWTRRANAIGWAALLGDAGPDEQVSPYNVPARATWLGDLPPVCIEVGSAEPFRDENIAFASAIWRDGGACELHVLPGGTHAFEGYVPHLAIAQQAMHTHGEFVRRLLKPSDVETVAERMVNAATQGYVEQ